MRTLVIASGNAGKIREFQGLLQHLPLNVEAQPQGFDVEETGSTFAANARIKATAMAATTGSWALADDSGLCVNALGGGARRALGALRPLRPGTDRKTARSAEQRQRT